MGELQQLHESCLELDRLAREALAGGDSGQLVDSMERWVQLVEGMVARCPAGPTLDAYRGSTERLEASLARLREAGDPAEVARLSQEMTAVVEGWTQALTEVLTEVVKAAP